MPIEKRDSIEQKEEIFSFLKQSRISIKNIKRLETFMSSPDPQVVELAIVVLNVAKIHPYKRRRIQNLARTKKDLLLKLEETGLIYAHHF